MRAHTRNRRRWFGAICIALAILMLIAGETVLKPKLAGVVLLGYWLVCLILTTLAAMAAIVDAARVGHEIREEQRLLVEETLRQIEREKRARDDSPK